MIEFKPWEILVHENTLDPVLLIFKKKVKKRQRGTLLFTQAYILYPPHFPHHASLLSPSLP